MILARSQKVILLFTAFIFSSCETTPTPSTDAGAPSTQTTTAPVQPKVDPLNSCPPRGFGLDVKSVIVDAKEALRKKDWKKAQS